MYINVTLNMKTIFVAGIIGGLAYALHSKNEKLKALMKEKEEVVDPKGE